MGKAAFSPERSTCPISTTLDLVGDKWSLLIIRDLTIGKSRYGEFLESPEGITTNILANRLKRLEAAGLIEKRPYQTRPIRHEYRLTEMGAKLLPVLQAMCRWANEFVDGTFVPPDTFLSRKA